MTGRALAALLTFLLACCTSGCGIYRDYPIGHDTPWPLVEVAGEGHERPRALVIRRLAPNEGGGQDLDFLHDEVVDSGLFAAVQTRATDTQRRPGYDYVLEFELRSETGATWVAWLALVPGFPLFTHETYTLTCRVYDGEHELMGEVSDSAEVDQALGLLILPWNVIYTLLPGRSSPYDLVGIAEREGLMVRALIRDALMKANERFDFRPPSLRTRGPGSPFAEGLEHLRAGRLPEAERAFQKLLRLDEGDELGWYNLACTYARAEKPDLAFPALLRAVKEGFRDRKHLATDPDLASLREGEQAELFVELLEALRKLEGESQGQEGEGESQGKEGEPKEPEGAQPEAPAPSQPEAPAPQEG